MVGRKGWCGINSKAHLQAFLGHSQQCRQGFCAGEGGLEPGSIHKKPFWETKPIGNRYVRGLQGIGHWTQCSAGITIHNKTVHSVDWCCCSQCAVYSHWKGLLRCQGTNITHSARMVWMGRQEKRGLELSKRSQVREVRILITILSQEYWASWSCFSSCFQTHSWSNKVCTTHTHGNLGILCNILKSNIIGKNYIFMNICNSRYIMQRIILVLWIGN